MQRCEFNQREREALCTIETLSDNTVHRLNSIYENEFQQTSEIRLKIVDKFTSEAIARTLSLLKIEARVKVQGTMEWNEPVGRGWFLPSAAAASTRGIDCTWALVGLLLVALMVQTSYFNRAAIARAARNVRNCFRCCRTPPPPLVITSASPLSPPSLPASTPLTESNTLSGTRSVEDSPPPPHHPGSSYVTPLL
uniref:Uncharacterized protein n=1 Tax=Plectus sambesii TaxID=2011161 RepID=A0A914UQU7_9BILA